MKALALAAWMTLASGAAWGGTGAAGADFLKLATGARGVSMGSGYSAVGGDLYSLYWNPAGISGISAPEAVISPVRLFDAGDGAGMYLFTLAGAVPGFPFRAGSMAAGITMLMSGDFDSTDPESLIAAAPGRASDQLFFVAYAAPVTESLAAGVTVKLIRRSLSGANPGGYVLDPASGELVPTSSRNLVSAGLGLDLGARWENLNGTASLGASIQNLGAMGGFRTGALPVNFGEGAEPLPSSVRVGGALRRRLWGQSLLGTLDLSSFFESLGSPRLSLGLEYAVNGMFFFRLGCEQKLDSPIGTGELDYGSRSGLANLPSPLRGGFGLRWPLGKATVGQFDYALAPFGALGVIHQAAVLLRWNIPSVPKPSLSGAPVQKKSAKPALVIEPREIEFDQPVKEWKVEIKDAQGKVVKTFAGTGLPPKSLDWDGTDERGEVLTDISDFKFVFKAKDVGNREVEETSDIPSIAAEAQIRAVAGKPLYPEVAFMMPQGDYEAWRLKIRAGGEPVREWEGKGKPQRRILWDGKGEDGNPAEMDKPTYSWEFVGRDGNRNRGERALVQVDAALKSDAFADRVRLLGVRFFGIDADITAEHLQVLKKAAQFIRDHPKSALTIESYAEATGTDNGDYDLARQRAEKVLRLLTDTYRLEAESVSVRVYGRSRKAPQFEGVNREAAKAQRVDLVIGVRR